MMYDIVIRGGAIVDGTGREPYMGDVAIREGVIVRWARSTVMRGR